MNITSELNDLVELLTDSQKGYGEAALHVGDQDLKEKFMRIGNGRAPMIEDLGNELARMGVETPGTGTAKGAMHRAWMEIRGVLTGNDATQLIDECERGDRHLVERYDDVIGNDWIPEDLRKKSLQHRIVILADLDVLRKMKQTLEQ